VEKSIPYREVDVTRATRKSKDKTVLSAIQQFTGRRTVPQVFIAETCIGGADELYSLEETGELGRLLASAEEKGQEALPSEVEQFVPLEGETTAEETASYDWDRYEELAKTARVLKKDLLSSSSSSSHSGERIVESLGATTREEAIAVGQELVAKRLLLCREGKEERKQTQFHGDESHLYSFPEVLPTEVFNGQMLWPADMNNDDENRNASQVAESLRLKILDLYEDFLSSDGNAVDYKQLARSAKFRDYVRSTSELREVDLAPLSREERIAFFVNIYNALVVHATAQVGAPASLVKRVQFFSKIKYCIGGSLYSCDDMEHGILRSNAVSPASLFNLVGLSCLASRTFSDKEDPRRKLVVEPLDPRIHFALVCGAKSCPPIRMYSAANLEEGLQGAAEAFCESEVTLARDKKMVTLSKIFKWYGKDFASKNVDLLKKIAEFRNNPQDELSQIIKTNPKSLKIKYAEYNWDVNSKE
jgi:glutaredoxin